MLLGEKFPLRAVMMVMLVMRLLSPNFALAFPRSKKRQSPSAAAASTPSANCG